MSFTFRNAQKATATGATSLTITKPTGLTVGDLMVAVIGKDDDPAITGPGDWTEVRGGTGTITGNDHSWWLGYKVADAGDVAASNFQWTGDAEDWSGTIAAFIPSNSNPTHVATSTAVLRQNDATPISNAITAATAANLLIGGAVAAQADTGGLGAQTSGYTVAASPAPTTGTGNGDNGSVLAYKLSATGGETTFEANNAESVAESHAFIMEFQDETGTQYDETGRSVSITATVAATDDHGVYYDETGKTVAVTATVNATDTLTHHYTENHSVAITATVTGTDTHSQQLKTVDGEETEISESTIRIRGLIRVEAD